MDDDPPKPHLTIASSREPIEIQRERKLREVEWETRELAANMIRVIRGAGRPPELFDRLVRLQDAIKAAPRDTTVGQVIAAMEAALSDGLADDEDSSAAQDAVQEIERGALRMVAARLLGQRVQVAAGNRDLWEGFHRLN